MEYRINVSKLLDDGRYYWHFDTTIDSPFQARIVYKDLKERFPFPLYKVEVFEWQSRGVQIDCWDDDVSMNYD